MFVCYYFHTQPGELGSVVVVAAELNDPGEGKMVVREPVVPRPAPPTARSVSWSYLELESQYWFLARY